MSRTRALLSPLELKPLRRWRWFARWRATRAGTARWVVHFVRDGAPFEFVAASRGRADTIAGELRQGPPTVEGVAGVRVERIR